jgi:hypothetical protein
MEAGEFFKIVLKASDFCLPTILKYFNYSGH